MREKAAVEVRNENTFQNSWTYKNRFDITGAHKQREHDAHVDNGTCMSSNASLNVQTANVVCGETNTYISTESGVLFSLQKSCIDFSAPKYLYNLIQINEIKKITQSEGDYIISKSPFNLYSYSNILYSPISVSVAWILNRFTACFYIQLNREEWICGWICLRETIPDRIG